MSAKATGITANGGILGDVTGDDRITITDALVVATYGIDNSIEPPEGGDLMLGDVNADGHVDISDALIIASYSVDPTNPNLPAASPKEWSRRCRLTPCRASCATGRARRSRAPRSGSGH